MLLQESIGKERRPLSRVVGDQAFIAPICNQSANASAVNALP